jgi:nucleotide sugar dehydrogenase
MSARSVAGLTGPDPLDREFPPPRVVAADERRPSGSVVVIGCGVVGAAIGRGLHKRGNDVTFVDVAAGVVMTLRSEGFTAQTPDQLDLADSDFIFICVPSPTRADDADFRYLEAACSDVGDALGRNGRTDRFPVVVIRSTVLPGTTTERLRPILESASGLRAGDDFGLCVNPEYLRADTAVEDFASPRLVVIGADDDRSYERLKALYEPFHVPIHRLPLIGAEFQKVAHNLINAAKISVFNELRRVCEHEGIVPAPVFELVALSAEGMWHAEYGIRKLGPYAGACLPKDLAAFLGWAADRTIPTPLMSAVREVNVDGGGD